jgi:hypothetical protein
MKPLAKYFVVIKENLRFFKIIFLTTQTLFNDEITEYTYPQPDRLSDYGGTDSCTN